MASVATQLDATDVDWRTLQQIEGMLSSLPTELERAPTAEVPHSPNGPTAPQADTILRSLQGSLAWRRKHEYVALESELPQQVDPGVWSAMGTMDRLGGSQHEARALPFSGIESADAR